MEDYATEGVALSSLSSILDMPFYEMKEEYS
jgi:hypothetical protein